MISNQSLLSIRLFYAAYFAAMGLILPYFPVYLTALGFNTLWVGIFVGALTAAKVIAPPLAGLILEQRDTKTRTFVFFISAMASVSALALFFHLNTALFFITVLLFGFFWAAILPLTDGLSLVVSEISLITYGRLRAWGSIGFIIASFAGGLWLVGEHIGQLPWLLAALLLFTTIASLAFPDLTTLNQHPAILASNKVPNQQALWWLFFVGFCMQASHGAYYGFFSLYMLDAGYTGGEIGLFWMLGVIAEIILMWFWSGPIQKASPVLVLGLSLLLAALRWFGLGFTTNLLAILLLQLLHAASFAAFHLSAVAWVRNFSAPQRQASAQGWYSSLGFGLGSTLGIMLCGYIVESSGYANAFFACTFIALLGLLAVWKLRQRMRQG